ncbi:hypothetical protein ILYODFUR_034495 [Ilyodon furcidens]|uniref:Uncharacterized protein n=1 Tax=Ilyodon furcidens TaxID=33524 RepID=A0ABV0TDH9_9TELE
MRPKWGKYKELLYSTEKHGGKLVSLETPLWLFTCAGVLEGSSIGYKSSDLLASDRIFLHLLGMAMWRKGSPASFCLSRYAPPLCRPVRHAGNGDKSLVSAGFIIPGDITAAMPLELRMLNCAAQSVPNKK